MPSHGKACKFHLCTSRSKKHPEKKFYPFIKPWIDRDRCLRWIAATGKKDLTTVFIDKHSYVCEDHFVNGAPSPENPDPLPMFIAVVASPNKPPFKLIGKNAFADRDHGETNVHDRLELRRDDNSCVRRGYVASGAPSSENPNSLPVLISIDDDREDVSNSQNDSCLTNTSTAGQASCTFKKKTISMRKTARLNQDPYCVPVSTSKVATEDDSQQSGYVCTSVPSTNDGNGTVQLVDTLGSWMASKDNVCKRRKLSTHVMVDGVENEEMSPLVGRSFQVSLESRESGECFDGTQAYVNKPTATGKLSTPGGHSARVQVSNENDAGNSGEENRKERSKRARVITINSGGRITILECDSLDDDDEDQ